MNDNPQKTAPAILPAKASRVFRQGSFQIRRVRPGLILGPDADPAFGPLSVIDHAHLGVGTTVPMHEHVNDEIFTYLWSGSMVHTDSTGQQVTTSPRRLMLMNAGKSFWHEESVPEAPVEALQIFVRPREADLPGSVQFYERPERVAGDAWHLIAGPDNTDAPLKIRQQVIVYDAHLAAGQVPSIPTANQFTPWMYVMDGTIRVDDARLGKGDALSYLNGDWPIIQAESRTTLVLFLVDRSAPAVRDGSISGL